MTSELLLTPQCCLSPLHEKAFCFRSRRGITEQGRSPPNSHPSDSHYARRALWAAVLKTPFYYRGNLLNIQGAVGPGASFLGDVEETILLYGYQSRSCQERETTQ